jgi:hypothetical protein
MVNEIFMKIYDKIGKKWRKFMTEISREAEGNDKSDIKFEAFKNICQKYGFTITENDKELLLDTTPGQDEG